MGKHSTLLLSVLLQLLSSCTGNQRMDQSRPMQFSYFIYNATIYENSAAKTYLQSPVKMGVYITHPSWEIRYKIVSGDNENLFKAEDYTLGDFCFLRIRTKGGSTAILNREVKDHYMLTIKAVEKSTNAESHTNVKVQVLDANDLRPLFSPTSYSVSLPENTALRTSIARVTATDADIGTNGAFYYSFRDRTDLFAIHPTSGVITLTGKLDYSETKQYEMEIFAVDRGMKLYGSSGISSMAKLTVHVEQANEYAPVITAVTLVPSDTDKDPTYAIVTVEDSDQGPNGEIASLSIVAGDPLQQFKAVRSSPGSKEYKIKEVGEVDWDSQPFGYNLTLQAKDKGSPPQFSSAKVVHVTSPQFRSGPPAFERNMYRVSTSVLTVSASDLDDGENGYVTYSIANLNPQPFVIDYFTGVISTSEDLDYELMPRIYSLRIRASDWGSPYRREAEVSVTITLNNLNDNKPLFEKIDCEVTIPRDLGVGEQITTVSAIDADELQLVRYEIKYGNDLDLFELNPNSGVLSLKQPLTDGDGAKVLFHSLQISANDGENFAPPMVINITVLTSRKPVQLQCVDTGVAKMLAEKLLQTTRLHSHVEPEDHFLDVHSENRYAPQFSGSFPSVIEVKEDLPVGARIILISATDSDGGFNGKLNYVISGGDTDSRFVVEMETGWLMVYAPLDRETTNHYTLNITVYDLGIPQKSAFRLLDVNIMDTNDNRPKFLQDSYSVEISENKEVGSDIIHIEATDKDLGLNGEVRYSLLADTDMFAINSETGVVKVISPLDREVHPSYLLKIVARDQAVEEPQLLSTVLLKVTLEDVNDNPPRFIPSNYHVKVREDLPIGTVIMWLEAHDSDLGQSSQVRYSLIDNGDGSFDVDKLSGAVRIVQSLDFEKRQIYNLTARAKDKGKPVSLSSTCYIEVEIVDINENLFAPWFSSFVDKGTVKEDAPIGTSVMKVTAHDEDKGRDGEIRYSIRDGSGLGVFKIDEESGVVKVISPLDREVHPSYLLKIVARDQAVEEPQLLSTVLLKVTLEDVNDNPPRFIPSNYHVKVREDLPIGTVIMWLEAHDSDLGQSSQVRYSLIDNGDGSFDVDKLSGAVRIVQSLDFEKRQIYNLTARAKDKGKPVSLSSTCYIEVEIVDINENLFAPWFSSFVDKGTVKEDAPIGTSVMKVTAHDEDKGRDGEIRYSIRDGSGLGVFKIDEESGIIRTEELLDHETTSHYWLTVYASDQGVVPLFSFIEVYIEVQDVNDNAPQTSEPVYYPEVMENSPKDTPVIQIEAYDPDTRSSDKLTYKITSGNPQGFFNVNPKTEDSGEHYKVQGD
ncbi:UNVERIFIED_CONTAM: hypothetical protein FKN15_056633 [Acipenser sinensis]